MGLGTWGLKTPGPKSPIPAFPGNPKSQVPTPNIRLMDRLRLASRLHREAEPTRWGVTPEVFADALARSTAKAFAGRTPSTADIERYQRSLHLADLALACACMEGHDEAWDHFVRRVSARALSRRGRDRSIRQRA